MTAEGTGPTDPRRHRSAAPRVAVALDGEQAPRWVEAILQSLEADENLDWVVTFVAPQSGSPRSRYHPLAVRLYRGVDRRHEIRRTDDPLEPCDVSVMTARRAAVHLGGGAGWPTGSTPSAFDVDVLLDLRDSSEPLPSDGAPVTWSVELSGVERGARVPPLFWALAHKVRVCQIRLVVERPSEREVAAVSTVSVTPGALMYSQDVVYRRATEIVRRQLRALAGGNIAAPAGAHISVDDLSCPVVPADRSATMAVLAVTTRRLGRTVRLAIEKRTRRSQWILGLRPLTDRSEPGNGDGFTLVQPPADRSYADPFLVADGDNLFVFYEQWPVRGGKGQIEVMDVGRDGSASGPRVVLQRDCHLSYPFVFQEGSAWYMIPETGANRTIELYRARNFPDEWELDRVLMNDVGARDTTLLRTKGKYWLFSVVDGGPGGDERDELHLFVSDSLMGPWRAHPLNPIVSDVRWARPAGSIFEHDGRLLRPAQDCSELYGGAIVFRQILKLDEEQYEERTFATQQPTWAPGLFAMHHYSRAGGMEVVDGAHMIKLRGERRAVE